MPVGTRTRMLIVNAAAVRQVKELRYVFELRPALLPQIGRELLDIGPAPLEDVQTLTVSLIPIGNPALCVMQQHRIVRALLKALVRGTFANARFGDRAGSPAYGLIGPR